LGFKFPLAFGDERSTAADILTSAHVLVFNAGNDDALGALSWPASENLHKARSRGKYGTLQCGECYGDRILVAISMVGAAPALCDLARCSVGFLDY
jgi:hypothetical protein